MIFSGFQKMTLLDFPGRVACTLFTAGCNLRCPFCHNASLVLQRSAESHTEEDILVYLKKRTGLLDGICITGGEPLMHQGLKDFIKQVKALGFAVKLDTNGCFPDRLKELIDEGLLDYVAMDVKSSMENYGKVVGIEGFDTANVEKSIDLLLENRVDFEFRTTAVSPLHTPEDIAALTARIKGTKKYFLQNFVDSGDLLGEDLTSLPREVLDEMLTAARENIPEAELRGV